MPKANGTFVKIYIYILKKLSCNEDFSTDDIAKTFEILESDVIKSLEYWNSLKVLNVSFKLDKTIEIEIPNIALYEVNDDLNVAASVIKDTNSNSSNNLTSKPIYRQDEISIYYENSSEVRDLFNFSEKQFGKPLKYEDLTILLNMYDWLRLPTEVINVLIKFCASSGYGLKYAEKIAINWSENAVDTREKAISMLTIYDASYKPVMKFMGLSSLAQNQKEFINKWSLKYGFSIEVILKACEISINAKGNNISFKYIDTILNSWHSNNLKTLEQIQKYREEKAKQYKEKNDNYKNSSVKKSASPKKNKFLSFPQTKYNFAEIEQMEMQRTLEEIKKAGIIDESSANNS